MTVRQDSRAVLLPSCDSLAVTPWLHDYLSQGGRTVLMSSTGAEYDARRISDERRARETPEQIREFSAAVASSAGAPVLVAVDAEPTGVQRLEHLLPPLPDRRDLPAISDAGLDSAFSRYAMAARDLGVGLFLSPVVDEIRGQNPWLQGRIMADDLESIARVAEVYVAAVQRSGITATAKHFPGHSDLSHHPVHIDTTLRIPRDEVERNLLPFRRLVGAGVGAVMVGPVVAEAIDAENPAACSPAVVNMLRNDVGFSGLIISDDLDAVSTMKGRSLGDVCVASLTAGVELLLIPGDDAVDECAEAIEAAAGSGRLSPSSLHTAASRVRALAALAPCHLAR